MKIEVRFFASLRERLGTGSVTLQLSRDAGYRELLDGLGRALPDADLSVLGSENVRLAVNQTLTVPPLVLGDGDEVAFLPPVTGG